MAVSRKKGDIHFNLACQGLFKNSSPQAGGWGVWGGGERELPTKWDHTILSAVR